MGIEFILYRVLFTTDKRYLNRIDSFAPKGALECGREAAAFFLRLLKAAASHCPLHASQSFASVTVFYREAARERRRLRLMPFTFCL
jgi:hypothetical protein